jgi:hypothetical protein
MWLTSTPLEVFSMTSVSYNHRKPSVLYLAWLLELVLVICPLLLSPLVVRRPSTPKGVKWPSVTSGSHVTTTKRKKNAGKSRGRAEHIPVRVTSGQKAPLGRIWRNFRLFNTNSDIFQLYHGENNLISVKWWCPLCTSPTGLSSIWAQLKSYLRWCYWKSRDRKWC